MCSKFAVISIWLKGYLARKKSFNLAGGPDKREGARKAKLTKQMRFLIVSGKFSSFKVIILEKNLFVVITKDMLPKRSE